MSRLDPNGADFDPSKKTTVSLGPSAGEIQGKNVEEAAMPEGPIKTAASYGERARQRQAATSAIKRGGKPLGGAPPIPPEKMRQIADGLSPRPRFGDEEEDEMPSIPRTPQEPPAQDFKGVGAAYHVNQEMARGNIDRPVSMKEAKTMAEEARKAPARKPLSQETVSALEKAKAQVEEKPPAPNMPEEDDIEEGLTAAEKEMIEEDTGIDMDFAGIEEARLVLLSPKRRKAIEDRLEPMDITDMITKREIHQQVTVLPGKLNYTFRTFNQHEHLFCLQYVFDQRGSQVYAEELLNTCKLVCALVAINGAQLPEHRKEVGTSKEHIDKDAFEKKMFHVSSFPTQMIGDMSVNAIWFSERVNKLFSLDEIKNG